MGYDKEQRDAQCLTFDEQKQARKVYKQLYKQLQKSDSQSELDDIIKSIPDTVRGWRVEALVRVYQEQSVKFREIAPPGSRGR